MWTVPGQSLYFKFDGTGLLWSNDKEIWYFSSMRSWGEIQQMHPTLVPLDTCSTDVGNDETEEQLREVFGETLDDEIPDDLWEMIMNAQ